MVHDEVRGYTHAGPRPLGHTSMLYTTNDLSRGSLEDRKYFFLLLGAGFMVALTCLAGAVFAWVRRKKQMEKLEAAMAHEEMKQKKEKEQAEAIEKVRKQRQLAIEQTGGIAYQPLNTSDAGKGLGALDDSEKGDDERMMLLIEKGTKDEFIHWANEKAQERRRKFEAYLGRRWWILLALFIFMIGTAVGIPALHAHEATCNRGFFWETHAQFFGVFLVTKVVELWLCATDPTLELEDLSVIEFCIKFFPSFLGYADAYLDASGMAIAHSCDTPFSQHLALGMFVTYFMGVVVMQWALLVGPAARDPSQACLLKIVHMDLLASCVSLPEDQKWLWDRIHYFRTFGEDVPQALFQTLYLIYVKENFFMLASVVMGVLSSAKALHDAISRALVIVTAGAEEDFQNRERSYEIYSGSQDGTIRCWDVRTGDCAREIDLDTPANCLGVTGTRLLSSHDDGRLREWSREDGSLVRTLEHPGGNMVVFVTAAMAYSFTGVGGKVKEWDLSTGQVVREYEASREAVRIFVHERNLYVPGPVSATDVAQYSLDTGELRHSYKGHRDGINALFATPNRLLSGSQDGTVREWSLAAKECTRTFDDHSGAFIAGLCVVKAYLYHASGSSDGGINERSLETGELLRVFEGHRAPIMTIVLLKATGNVYTASADRTIREWDVLTGECKRVFEGHTSAVNDLVVQPRTDDH